MFIAITIVVCDCKIFAADKPEPKPAPEPRVPYIPKVEVRKKKK